MKKSILIALASIFIISSSCSNDENNVDTQETVLSLQEKNDLIFSREEEKLAMDVYLFSYEKYGDVIFKNIAYSEQSHMGQILVQLNYFNLSDPASSERGVFTNQDLQNLYNDLIAKSTVSRVEALKVGAFIEDLDIYDLEGLESRTTNESILNTYDILKCGSRNHLRNFIGQLETAVVNYVPQYISLAAYTEIINSDYEICSVNFN